MARVLWLFSHASRSSFFQTGQTFLLNFDLQCSFLLRKSTRKSSSGAMLKSCNYRRSNSLNAPSRVRSCASHSFRVPRFLGFRRDGRFFLILSTDSIIDLTHPNPVRRWTRKEENTRCGTITIRAADWPGGTESKQLFRQTRCL